MAKQKTPRYQDSFSLDGEDDVHDYQDKHNGSLYDIAPSRTGESYTVLFYTDQTYSEMSKLLEGRYQFQTNKSKCGLETSFILCDKKVVLTLDSNKRLLIQGGGCKLWRNSVFRKLSEKLTPYVDKQVDENIVVKDDDDLIYSHTETPVRSTVTDDFQTPPGRVKTVLNKMINKLRSPGVSEKIPSPETNDTVKKPAKMFV
ncbi:MAG: hypothetical protein AB2693_27785 [Candidatus Thiodiazotropha sp.]